MLGRTAVHLDSTSLDAAAKLLGTTRPEETVECALALTLRLGDSVRELGMGPVQDPTQLALLEEEDILVENGNPAVFPNRIVGSPHK
jgi:hypothetical protein